MSISGFGKVGVLFGGRSSEREVSIMSGTGVLNALRSRGIDAHAFDPATQPLGELETAKFDRVFIALHGRGGEDGAIQGALETLRIPYTGSGVKRPRSRSTRCLPSAYGRCTSCRHHATA